MNKNHFEMVLEDINSKLQIILEGHEVLRNEIREARDESNAKHDRTASLLDILSHKIDALDANIGAKLAGLAARI